MKPLDRLLQCWRFSRAKPYIAAGARVLDIGCAAGDLFRHFPQIRDGVGIDPDLPGSAQSAPNAILLKGFFPQALADARPFDVITMLAVLEHVPPERQQALALACADYLKPGGHLVVTVPSPLVDMILTALRFFRLIDGMALEQHYGYDPGQTLGLFALDGLELADSHRFQLGLNNLFVFRKIGVAQQPAHEERQTRLATAAV